MIRRGRPGLNLFCLVPHFLPRTSSHMTRKRCKTNL